MELSTKVTVWNEKLQTVASQSHGFVSGVQHKQFQFSCFFFTLFYKTVNEKTYDKAPAVIVVDYLIISW